MKRDKQENDLESNEVFMVAQGVLNAWVCAPKSMSIEEVQEGVDKLPPAGTFCGWQVTKQVDDDPHHCSPGLCAEDDNRQHWLCYC